MSDHIKNFRLSAIEGNQGYKRVLLQLFGLPGNGKSSFINSCKFVIDGGAFVLIAEAADSQGAKTTKRISYELTEDICLVDNRGMPFLDRFRTGEIFAQLGNLLPLNKDVEWVEDFNINLRRVMAGNNKEDNLHDLIIPVLIHSVRNSIQVEVEFYRNLLNTARKLTGIEPYVVLTHKSSGGVESMKSAFTDMGLRKIYSVENYTEEAPMRVREKHNDIINFLTEVLEDIKFRMENMEDPKNERARCLEFFINYIKETSDKKKDEEHEMKKLAEEPLRKSCFFF